MEKLTHFMTMENKRFLGSWDLCVGEDGNGNPVYQPVFGTIQRVAKEEVYEANTNTKKTVTVCYFSNGLKPMILNKTNMEAIEKACRTPFLEKWTGNTVQITVKRVKAFRKEVDALLIDGVAQVEKLYKCESCGDDKVPADIARRTKKKFGIILCMDCGTKKAEEVANAQ